MSDEKVLPYPAEFYPGCPCRACDAPTWPAGWPGERRMSLCPTCGNKRCPGAANHTNECTHSNAVGQPGSLWADVVPFAEIERDESAGS